MSYNRKINIVCSVLCFLLWLACLFCKLTGVHSWYITVGWLVFGGTVFFVKKTISISLKDIQTLFFAFNLYTVLVSIVNYICGTESMYGSLTSMLSLCLIGIPAAIAYFFVSRSHAALFFRLLLIFMLVSSLLGIYDYFARDFWYSGLLGTSVAKDNFRLYCLEAETEYRVTLFFYHPIFFSMVLLIAVIYLFYYPYRYRWLNYAAVLLLLANMLLTKTRTGWILLICFFIIFAFKNRERLKNERKRIWVIAISSIIAAAVLYLVFPEKAIEILRIIPDRVVNIFSVARYSVRTRNWVLVKSMLEEGQYGKLLFGGGYLYGYTFLQSHPIQLGSSLWNRAIDNQYVTFLMDYGILGTAVFMAYLIATIRKAFITTDKQEEMLLIMTALLLLSGITYEFHGYTYVFYLILILSGMAKNEKNERIIVSIQNPRRVSGSEAQDAGGAAAGRML